MVDDLKQERQENMDIVNQKQMFSVVAFEIHTITPKNKHGNTKVIFNIYLFTRYVRAILITDENAKRLAQALLEQ